MMGTTPKNTGSNNTTMKIDAHVFTALPIAASRAIATTKDSLLVNDPLARRFLQGHEHLLQYASANTEYMTMRCLLGDALVLQQYKEQGVRQVISLGAGMDSRAFRLDLPGTAFYEVDKADLFRIKEPLVQGVPLTCQRRSTVTGTLGDMNLTQSLEHAGFDRQQPTTWLMEGLLPYLTRPVLESVATEMGELSAPGSAMWGDSFSKTSVDRGMEFHGVPFASGADDYDVVFRQLGGFDHAFVMDFSGIWLNRAERRVEMDSRYKLTPETTRARQICLMVQAHKTK
jgi:methyltransferase (TIGR00027 family)